MLAVMPSDKFATRSFYDRLHKEICLPDAYRPRKTILKYKMRVITTIICLTAACYANGQTLSLDYIFDLRTMDSVKLRAFASQRGFEFKGAETDIWRSVHKYFCRADTSVSFEKTFPTGRTVNPQYPITRDNRTVYYHFRNKDILKELKKQMREKGFKFKTTDTNEYGGNTFRHHIYLTKDQEIDLSSEKLLGQKIKYTLIYHSRIN